MSSPVLEIRDLKKRYGRIEALRGLDLTVNEGEVYGFLGRNGAGKTTTIRILMGITNATSGEILVFGERLGRDPVKIRQKIGYVAQEQNFYPWMTPVTIGRFVRGFFPTWDDAEYARLLGAMELPLDRKIGTFSGGMRAKLALGLALAHRPHLLLLDEPTAGLDPVARREFVEMVREQAERTGRTTFFSSHILDEVERAADRVGIVDDGRMKYQGPLAELSAEIRILKHAATSVSESGIVHVTIPELPPAVAVGGFLVLQDRVRHGEREVVVRGSRWDDVLAGAPGWTLEPLSLEDIFVEMVSKPLAKAL
jgi:ABC-2 type transport system ATP-binding protein